MVISWKEALHFRFSAQKITMRHSGIILKIHWADMHFEKEQSLMIWTLTFFWAIATYIFTQLIIQNIKYNSPGTTTLVLYMVLTYMCTAVVASCVLDMEVYILGEMICWCHESEDTLLIRSATYASMHLILLTTLLLFGSLAPKNIIRKGRSKIAPLFLY